jgi:hypothetical protein
MVTDEQVRMLMTLINREKTLAVAAAKAGMTEKTARKYRDLEQLPSQTSRRIYAALSGPAKLLWL